MTNRTQKMRRALALGLIATALGGLLTGIIVSQGRASIPPLLLGLLVAGIFVATCAALLPWWRRLDHMERDSHLTSWYWGGSLGGGIGVIVLLVLAGGVRDQLVVGAALVLLAQIVGYAAALLVWWIVHRSRAA